MKINILLIYLISSIKSSITGLDSEIVVGLEVINDKKKPSQVCPLGYIPSSGCEDEIPCDLNYGVGGNFIYLCQKKVKFKDLSLKYKPISKILVNYNSKNCGNLNVIDSDLNKGAGGEFIYLCYGSNNEDPTPIIDVFINIKGKNTVPAGYICDENDLNKGSKKNQEIYICFLKDKKIPETIEYSNLIFDINKKSMSDIKDPNDIVYIDNDNSSGDSSQSIKRIVSNTIENNYSWNFNKSFNFVNKIAFNATIPLIISEEISFHFEFNENESKEYTHNLSEKEEIEYSCIAPARQHLMCKAFNSNYKISIPYKVDIIYHFYDGSKEIEQYQSKMTGIMGSSIQFSKCCISGCQNLDNLCSNEEINNNDFISGTCPEKYRDKLSSNKQNDDDNQLFIVSDLIIINSNEKWINCPAGYSIVNSGCDDSGCDLNYGAGGQFIYLCQKKQKLNSLKYNEKPVNSIKIIYDNEKCAGSLKLIDLDLNKGAKGAYIYLCYGNEENIILEPIADFFIYIKNLNSPPIGYLCETTKNLNKGTKGNEIYLCYTRNSSLLYYEEDQFNTNLTVITDLDIVFDKRKTIFCPDGYDIVNAGCNIEGCDLNHGSGGYFIYLCQKKEQINKISLTQKPINTFKIVFDKNNNKDLKLIDVDLNKGCGGEYIYLTYGHEYEEPLSPIVDFFIYIVNVNFPPKDYECDHNDLNKGAGGSFIYLCFKRDDNLPKEIIVNNLELNYAESKKVSLGLPHKLEEIKVNSASVIKTIEKTITEEKYIQKSFNSFSSLETSFSFLFIKEIGLSLNEHFSLNEEWKESISKTLSTQIECHAESRKTMMCIPFYSNFEVDIPYIASLTYINYKGEILGRKDFNGIYKKVACSQISYKTCCLEGCCTGNTILDADKPQCNNNKKDILCNEIQNCF